MTYKLPHHTQSGFTLLELMIVVAIVGILSALGLSAYQTYVVRSQITAGISLLTAPKSAIVTVYTETGAPPANRTAAGLTATPTDTQGKYVTSVDVTNGVITLTYGYDASAEISGQQLYMTPYASGDNGVVWRCGNAAVPAGLLPLGTGTAVVANYIATPIDNRYLPAACRQ